MTKTTTKAITALACLISGVLTIPAHAGERQIFRLYTCFRGDPGTPKSQSNYCNFESNTVFGSLDDCLEYRRRMGFPPTWREEDGTNTLGCVTKTVPTWEPAR